MKNLDQLVSEHHLSIRTTACPQRTICEVLRELWEISELIDEEDLRSEQQVRLLVAYDMAKRMNRKLREYKHDWDDTFWNANDDFKKDLIRRSKKICSIPP